MMEHHKAHTTIQALQGQTQKVANRISRVRSRNKSEQRTKKQF